MKDKKRTADELEKYIDRAADYDGELDPELEQVVDSLHQATSHTQPRPGFVNELAQQLQEKEQTMSEKRFGPNFWHIFRRVAAGGVALAALVALVLVASALFTRPELEPAATDGETAPPAQTVAVTKGNFAGAEFVLTTELSDAPAAAPLLAVNPSPLSDGVEDALATAREFGITDGTVYAAPNDPGRWIVMAGDGRNVSFRPGDPQASQIYYNNPPAQQETGAPLPYDEAVAIVRDFLQIPAGYELAPEQSSSSSVRIVQFHKVVDGHPIVGNDVVAEAAVGPGGQVAYARVMPIDVTPAGEPVPVKSAQQAFDDLVQGVGDYSFSYSYVTPSDAPRYFTPPVPGWVVGDAATVSGWLTVLTPVEGGQPLTQLHTNSGAIYRLAGPAVADLADDSDRQIEASGTIAQQLGPARWELALASWEAQQPGGGSTPPTCRTGTFRRDGDVARLEGDEGETVELAYPPEELRSGERIEVCAEAFPAGEPVEWLHMASPPSSEAAPAGGGGGGGGGGSVTVVEVTRVITEESGERVVEETIGGGGGSSSSQPAVETGASEDTAAETPPFPFSQGERVEITGVVQGIIRLQDGERTPDLILEVDLDDEVLTPPLSFRLVGAPDALEAVAEHYLLHVTVDGILLDSGEGSGAVPTIQVEGVERTYPDEEVEAFLGHIKTETLAGQDVAVFTDEATGQRYVLSPQHTGPDTEQRVWLAGVVHPEATVDGLPVLRQVRSQSGSDVDAAESAGDIPLQVEIPEYDEARSSGPAGLQGTLIIDRVLLGYQYQPTPGPRETAADTGPQTLTPVWIFYGHSQDNSTIFTIFADATLAESGG